MPTKNFKSNSSLGKSLINKQHAKKPKGKTAEGYVVHTTEITDHKP
jgi:hypothetical protein